MKARPVWLILGSVFTVATLAWGIVSAVNAFAYERTKSHLTLDGPVDTAVLRSRSGSVKIIGTMPMHTLAAFGMGFDHQQLKGLIAAYKAS